MMRGDAFSLGVYVGKLGRYVQPPFASQDKGYLDLSAYQESYYVLDEGKPWTAAPNFLAYGAPKRAGESRELAFQL
jgi:hypothetical protein